MSKRSSLEDAICTLVTQFQNASADKSGTLKMDEFKNLLSSQLPSLAKGFGTDQGFGKILQQMGVGEGEGINFKHFWSLIQNLATTQFNGLIQNAGRTCTCVLL
ncbi:S100 calcium binding protein V2 [Pholidichthys leucotaenia]